MTETDRTDPGEQPTGLQAIWANTTRPVAPLPWYRRVSRKVIAAVVVVVGLFTALTVAAVTGAGAPPAHRIALADRIGDQVRMPDDKWVTAARSDFRPGLTALSPYRQLEVVGYGTGGSGGSTLLFVGLTGSFPDARMELDKYFGHPTAPGVSGGNVTDRQDYPTGSLGGVLQCATVPTDTGSRTAICVWADGTTVGFVDDLTGAVRPQDLAERALEIRTAVEVEA
ncbi:hypothetical protein [Streptomyces rubellomurinus]|uniref:Uncharacterized protein n=1 Tax=Streptomyces rubellomurinus (strain ATCC 31215) TaxID=359131 RepID=A0A0F2THF7_STRR3|nr:hypothetical protein [Streptomyces rubellomurinus]KJS62614.1 hypothetical protein VM95_07370 [Streptomyces rubellomurinus]